MVNDQLEREPTMKARATARFAGGRGNELLIQVYI